MHSLKQIRENFDFYKKKLSDRYSDINLNELITLDKKNREIIQTKEKLEQEKKTISKSKDKSLFEKSKKITNDIKTLEVSLKEIKNKIDFIMDFMPNIALNDVPIGKDENSNKELKKVGKIQKFDFNPLSHYDLGTRLNLLDFDIASKTSGARFVFLKGKLAELERALSNFMLDIHTKEFGYNEISPPLIVTEKTMYGTGQIPKFENDQFEIKLLGDQKKYLIPTAEVILTNMYQDTSINLKDLPIRMVIYCLF